MTREEAIEVLRRLPIGLMDLSCEQKSDLTEALNIALAALRAPTREQVEKVWRTHWLTLPTDESGGSVKDYAVDILLKRFEVLKDGKKAD